MSVVSQPSLVARFAGLFREQKAIVGDYLDNMFNRGFVHQPRELATYRKYYDLDSTVGVSIDTLSEMVAGSGIYLTVKDEKNSASKAALDECNALLDRLRLDEFLLNVDKCMNIFGFCPAERVTRRGPPGGILQLMVLDPPSVEYQRERIGGEFTSFIQKTDSKPISFGPDELIWFVNNQAGNGKRAMYGISRIARVLALLEVRDQIIENIGSIMRNQARPPIIWKVKSPGDVQTLKALLKDAKNAGGDPVLYPKDGVEHEVVKIDNRSAYWEYVSYIDGLIFQGLHSPMLDYLRNATEASANTMLEVIQRHVEGRQRYLKRMVEYEVFEWHLERKGLSTEDLPQVHFGAPQTGLEEIKVDRLLDVGLQAGFINQEQFYDILRQKGLTLTVPNPDQAGLPAAVAGGAVDPSKPKALTVHLHTDSEPAAGQGQDGEDDERFLRLQETKARIAAYKRIATS